MTSTFGFIPETPALHAQAASERTTARKAAEHRRTAARVARQASTLADEVQAEIDAYSTNSRAADYRIADLAATRSWLRRYAEDAEHGRLSDASLRASDALFDLVRSSIEGGDAFTDSLLDGVSDDGSTANAPATSRFVDVRAFRRDDGIAVRSHKRRNPHT